MGGFTMKKFLSLLCALAIVHSYIYIYISNDSALAEQTIEQPTTPYTAEEPQEGDYPMADMSKISVNGTEYDIKDQTAQEGVAALAKEMTTKLSIAPVSKISFFGTADVATSTPLATTRRWFLNKAIPAGAHITKFSFANRSLQPETYINVEVWELAGEELTKVASKKVATGVTQTYTVEIDYTTKHTAYIGLWQSVSTISYVEAAGDWLLATTDNGEDVSSLQQTQLNVFGGFKPSVTVEYEYAADNVVVIGAGQKYENIQDALEAITDDSAENPYTFLLMPSATPYSRFSMIRSLDGTYPWSGITPRWISIIGLDKANTIVQSDTGEYASPPAEILTNGIIKNITFRMTNDKPAQYPVQGGYAVHIDCRTRDDMGYAMVFEDCDFESATGPAMGIGLHENGSLAFRRCRFISTASATYVPSDSYKNLYDYGCVFAHTSTLADSVNQRLAFEDCIGICAEGDKSLWVSSAGNYSPDTADFEYTLIRNVFWNKAAGSNGYVISNNLRGNPMNFGNND